MRRCDRVGVEGVRCTRGAKIYLYSLYPHNVYMVINTSLKMVSGWKVFAARGERQYIYIVYNYILFTSF